MVYVGEGETKKEHETTANYFNCSVTVNRWIAAVAVQTTLEDSNSVYLPCIHPIQLSHQQVSFSVFRILLRLNFSIAWNRLIRSGASASY